MEHDKFLNLCLLLSVRKMVVIQKRLNILIFFCKFSIAYLCMPHFLERKERIELGDKLDNGRELVGHSVFLLCFQHLPTTREITGRGI